MISDLIALFLSKYRNLGNNWSYMTDKEKEREKEEKVRLQKRFGKHLKSLRESKDITAAELARLCEMERSNIARLETGGMNPSLFVLKKLSLGLNIELGDLLKDFK